MASDKILHMLIPVLLAAILSLLGWMGNSLNRISESLAVVVHQIETHDKRINELEVWRRDQIILVPRIRR